MRACTNLWYGCQCTCRPASRGTEFPNLFVVNNPSSPAWCWWRGRLGGALGRGPPRRIRSSAFMLSPLTRASPSTTDARVVIHEASWILQLAPPKPCTLGFAEDNVRFGIRLPHAEPLRRNHSNCSRRARTSAWYCIAQTTWPYRRE